MERFCFTVNWRYALAHAIVIVVANLLVSHPFPAAPTFLTWAAFVSPVSFFVTDTCNRRRGLRETRRMVRRSFVIALIVSFLFAEHRIAIASGTAFLLAQSVDAIVFDRMRRQAWCTAPMVSGVVASAVDGTLFFVLAFYGSDVPWISWALADYLIKLGMLVVFLPVYGAIVFSVSDTAAMTGAEHHGT
ncbi:hypothetical protein C7H84_34005 [Burkholderia sp. Nafp2/4-1b]|uniref:VUT family protein n=1 Tax=Burkholderia sp. Nafp2/4-1b TaxID=2116686 RepID=UPI000EF9155F|nr:VUT family protein [Burkholderia sp. Nafp2/4-1b]RKT98973.1 hypothetical protein C7H84_34005 [Burkholderia sp. Nafp2/4-1b]